MSRDRTTLVSAGLLCIVARASWFPPLEGSAPTGSAPASPVPPASAPSPEWTFEEAQRCWQPMVRPVQHVGVPGYQFQAGVLWDGSLLFGPLGFRDLKVMQDEIAPLGETRLHVSVGYGDPLRFVDRKGTADPAILRRLEEGRLPMPHVLTRDGDLLWDELVFAHLLGRRLEDSMPPRPEDILVVHAVFRVRNTGLKRRTGHLWLHLGDTSSVELGYKCIQKEVLAPAIEHRYEAPLGLVGPAGLAGPVEDKVRYALPAPSRGEVRWHDAAPAPGIGSTATGEGSQATAGGSPAKQGGAQATRLLHWVVPLSAGEEATLRLIVPYGPVGVEVGRRIAALDTEALRGEAARYWRRLVHGPGQITTPDPFVNDYLAAVAAQMAQQVAYRHRSRVWLYKTSPNHYEGYWPCNAAKALPTLGLRGLLGLERPVLGSFIEQRSDDVRGMARGVMGRDEGLAGEGYAKAPGFLGNFGEWTANPLLLSHGLGMWALASHFRITRDEAWLRSGGAQSPLEVLIAAFDWVALQRRRTMREADGRKVEHWGLLPAASAHDWLAGNTIFNDAFCIYGMAEVVRLLRETKHPRAEEMARELSEYRACLRERYAEARDRARRLPLGDGTSIPFVPRLVQELDWAKPDWTYTMLSALRAGVWGAFDPRDELVDQALAFLEAGMPKGEGAYFSAPATALAEAGGRRPSADVNWTDVSDPAAERHYLWRHYVEYETMWPIGGPLFLARDDLPRFFEWLFHNLSVVIHRDWRVGVESLDGVPSCAPGDGERWQCVRKMFVHERCGYDGSGQSLWLLQAIPRSWLRPGDRLSVRDMGTWLGGKVDLEVEVSPDGGSVTAGVRWRDLAVLPTEVVLRLRSGDGRPLRSAEAGDIRLGETAGGQARAGGVRAAARLEVGPGDTVRLPVAASATFRVVGRFE